jgi:hypothetical protein
LEFLWKSKEVKVSWSENKGIDWPAFSCYNLIMVSIMCRRGGGMVMKLDRVL